MNRGVVMALVAMGLGVIVIANDFTALNVALPAIEQDFDVDVGTVAWVINAYALTFGMAIVTGGRLADMFGRRRVFFIGAAIFAGFSLLGGLAQSAPQLIAMRVGMGIGGALMWPAILGMTFAALPPAKAGLAGGVILGAAGLGNAIGPLVGGALTDLASWRWIFFLNVPVAAVAVAVTWAKVHQPPVEGGDRRIDYRGIVAVSLGLLLLMLALDQSSDWGWGDARVLAMLAGSVVALAAFVVVEPRAGEAALIPKDVISNRRFASACIVVLLMSAVFFTTVLYVPQLMQKILGWSPLGSGAGLLPMLAVFAGVSFVAGRLYERVGGRPVILSGAACIAVGPLLLSLFDGDSGYAVLLPGLIVTGLGIGLFYPSITTAAVTALDAARSSLAGGIVYMFQIAGGAVGLALMTAIFTTSSEERVASDAAERGISMSGEQASVIHGVLAGTDSGQAAFEDFRTAVADRVLDVVRDSFAAGVQTSLRVAAAIAVAGFVIALLFVRPERE
ncbi:MAG TPA: MFS transporter, partial [Solirubrobacterales bacterium]|nr:MFS transporter [Solirubrobacterales bacterium]